MKFGTYLAVLEGDSWDDFVFGGYSSPVKGG